MHVVVVAGGELLREYTSALAREIEQAELVVAADSGLDHCRSVKAWPDVLVGDLDSASTVRIDQARSHDVKVVDFPIDKNATDLELAIEYAVGQGATSVTVFAVFGDRIDHELATVGLLASPRWATIDISGTDGRRSLWVVRRAITLDESIGRTVTLVPWAGDVIGVSTTGLQWPLVGEPLPLGSTRGVSNICVESPQTITVDDGTLLVVVDRVI